MSHPSQKPAPPVMILACSGASNVGQLSNQAAVELTREGFGQMFCLAAIGAHLPKFVSYAQKVPSMVAIDGCSLGCIRAILEHAKVPLQNYVVLTDLGIEKNMNAILNISDIERVKQTVKDRVKSTSATPTLSP